MLLVACASTNPSMASAKSRQLHAGAVAAASNPPIRPDVIVIENTQARVMSSQRDTGSMVRPGGRFPVTMICRQLSKSDGGSAGVVSAPGIETTTAGLLMRGVFIGWPG